jgi:hypothetical protein
VPKISDFDAMQDALEICSDLGLEMAPGFATHWPMAVEAMIRLGYAERLMAGMSAGLTHGLIRTAHAVRSFSLAEGEPTKLQLNEFAAGLAYWAALHTVQPGHHKLSGAAQFPSVIGSVPRLERRAGVVERGRYEREIPGWPEAVASLSSPKDIGAALSDMTAAFVQVNLAHNKGFPVPLIHTVTAPAALRMMLPHLPQSYHGPSFVAAWEASAAVLSNFAVAKPEEMSVSTEGEKASWDELAARAVENGDEHAIKFTEACWREDGERADPRYAIAAAQMIPRLPPYFRGQA